ncbi:peptidoglycan DD-metalloendopeptidase family protein [Bacillus sp. NTK071]|uniref:peptidoglycan DD-metalloendopeptidase family protein n=1 Tax=Bacillus sp. NTK071 TaxID=2802175 RepID=UPI001A8E115B|nr:peptidoglycan DD-metalloendopeptidase family protein [Bacillus sp. NTK071]MBN8210935.1 peptidoglycan DD-metalloendopeptidase family protein [Bacillus sp. NTK071]
MGDEKQRSHPIEKSASKWQKLARKRWIYPAVYLGFAAIVLAAVLWMQGGQENAGPRDLSGVNEERSAFDANDESVPVLGDSEVFKVPASEDSGVFVQKQFYDTAASTEEQQAALVFYNNTYYQNAGIDYAKEDGSSFDVKAAMTGKVVKATEDQLLGNVVHLEHANGVVTVYESLDALEVSEGDKVEQGDKLGTAGTNTFDTDAGVHVHFEVRKDGSAVNPLDVFNQPASAIEGKQNTEAGDAVSNPSASEGTEQKGTESEMDAEKKAEDDAKGADEDKSNEQNNNEQKSDQEKSDTKDSQ